MHTTGLTIPLLLLCSLRLAFQQHIATFPGHPFWRMSSRRIRAEMCKYQYHYYSKCQHQEVILQAVCDSATRRVCTLKAEGAIGNVCRSGHKQNQDDFLQSQPSEDKPLDKDIETGASAIPSVGLIHTEPSFAYHPLPQKHCPGSTRCNFKTSFAASMHDTSQKTRG